MKFVQVWLLCIVVVKKLNCQTIATNSSIAANRKQLLLVNSSLDFSAKPCDDFYQLACGKWGNLQKEAGGNYHDAISLVDYKANKEMSGIFDEMHLENQPNYIKRAYEFYKSCKDVEEYKTMHYLNWITEKENLKLPPLWRSRLRRQKYDWVKILAVMRSYGLNGLLIEEHVVQRNDDPLEFIIEIQKPVRKGGFQVLTRDMLEHVATSLGVPPDSINVIKLWAEVQELELDIKQLNDLYFSDWEKYQPNWPVKKVQDIPYPWLNDYIKILYNTTELDPNTEIHIKQFLYFQVLDEFVKKHNKNILCKYLEIRFLWHLHQQEKTNLTPENCVSHVRSTLPLAMEWLYEQQHPELQLEYPIIFEIYEDIKQQFYNTLQQTEEGVPELFRINIMQMKLSNIPRENTVQTLEEFYEDLDPKVHEFYANHLELLKFNFKATHKLLSGTTQQNEFFHLDIFNSGASSSPFQIKTYNTVVVPLTLLQQPIYQPDSSNMFKYSTFGFLLARTMFKIFDDDEYILQNPLIRLNYQCRGNLTNGRQEEQIADISGLRFANKLFNDTRTDNMGYKLNVIFFLNFAQLFCVTSEESEESAIQQINGTGRDRIGDALKFFPEFSNIFHCNNTHRLYADEECDGYKNRFES